MTHSINPRRLPLPRQEALDALLSFVDAHRMSGPDDEFDFMAFERGLHERVIKLERELLGEVIQQADIDAPALMIDGERYTKVLNSHTTITTAAGDVRVKHTLYKNRSGDGRSVSALHKRLGIVDGFTPHAASLALFVVTERVPQKASELFERIGNMTPSKSTLDRLPKSLSKVWEADRNNYEAMLREATEVPPGTHTIAVFIDGVLAPMVDGGRADKRKEAAARGQLTKGPAGYREVGCATVSCCDAKGQMLSAIRMARSPEARKATVKSMLQAEVDALLTRHPHLRVVKLADGAEDNWRFFSAELVEGVEVLDFFHAAEHLSDALGAVYGEGTIEARCRFADLRYVLLEVDGGVENVIRSLAYLAKKHPNKARVRQVLS